MSGRPTFLRRLACLLFDHEPRFERDGPVWLVARCARCGDEVFRIVRLDLGGTGAS